MKSTLIWSPLFPHKIFSQEISDRQVPPSLSLSIWIYLPPPPLCLTHSLLTIFEAPTPCSHLGSLVTLVLLFFSPSAPFLSFSSLSYSSLVLPLVIEPVSLLPSCFPNWHTLTFPGLSPRVDPPYLFSRPLLPDPIIFRQSKKSKTVPTKDRLLWGAHAGMAPCGGSSLFNGKPIARCSPKLTVYW